MSSKFLLMLKSKSKLGSKSQMHTKTQTSFNLKEPGVLSRGWFK